MGDKLPRRLTIEGREYQRLDPPWAKRSHVPASAICQRPACRRVYGAHRFPDEACPLGQVPGQWDAQHRFTHTEAHDDG